MDKLGPYELNTIVTGDARILAESIPDESVDLIFTDPPWGIDFKYSNGYQDNPDNYISLVTWIVDQSNRVLKPGGFAFVYQATKRLREIWSYFPEDSRLFSSCKNFIQLKKIPVEYAIDYIVFWQKTGDFNLSGMVRDWHIANTADTSGSRGVKYKTSPPSPLDAVIDIVSKMSSSSQVIVDFFAGSGTTILAAKKLGRNYLAFEIDPATADKARQLVEMTQPLLFIIQPEQVSMFEVG